MIDFNLARSIGKNIRLVVCDLDGTLLNERFDISCENLKAIRRAQEKGIFVTICTGRIYRMTEYYVKLMDLRGPLVNANGACIVDSSLEKTIWERTLDYYQVKDLLEFCRDIGMDYGVLGREGGAYSLNSTRVNRILGYNDIARSHGEREIPVSVLDSDHECVKNMKIYKILIQQVREGQLDQIRSFIDEHTDLGYTSSEPGLLDVSARGISKGDGVRKLAALMDIPLEQTCAFGDYENDKSMFSVAGLSIAMENSSQSVKSSAMIVTRSNREDGVAYGLNKYIL